MIESPLAYGEEQNRLPKTGLTYPLQEEIGRQCRILLQELQICIDQHIPGATDLFVRVTEPRSLAGEMTFEQFSEEVIRLCAELQRRLAEATISFPRVAEETQQTAAQADPGLQPAA